MDILCPLCQNKLTIQDQYAGQVLQCPTCSGKFQAPTLPGAPPASAPPPVEQPLLQETPAPTPSAPLPPLPDGFNHIYFLTFKQEIISWIAPASLILIFVFSFFPWTTITTNEYKKETVDSDNVVTKASSPAIFAKESMWTTAVVSFIVYIIFYFFTLIFAVLAILLDKKVFSLPEPLKPARRWRSMFVAGFGFVGLFTLLLHWASTLNFAEPNPNTAVFSIVMFLQFLVVAAPLLEYWLQQRKKNDLPQPRLALHW